MIGFKNILKILVLVFVIESCNKDDDPVPPQPVVTDKPDPDPVNQAPGSFSLLAVEDNDTVVNRTPTLSWEQATDPDGDMVKYDVYVDTNSDPQIKVASDLQTTSFTIGDTLDLVSDYYWKVLAKDGNGGETFSGIFQFKTSGFLKTSPINDNAAISLLDAHEALVFQDKIWLLGGFANNQVENEVWSSADGLTWDGPRANSEPKFTPRFFHKAAVFQDKMWVIGGNADNILNDVWASSDGDNWEELEQLQQDEFPARNDHTLTVFNDRLYLIGGVTTGGTQLMDVWSSVDGMTWNLETDSAEFGPRNFHQVASFKEKLWMIGGLKDDGTTGSDVWNSDDGKSWSLVTTAAEFGERVGHRVLVFDNKLWLIGSATQNDIWVSDDGENWNDATPDESYPQRANFTATYFQDQIWIVAGGSKRDIWTFE